MIKKLFIFIAVIVGLLAITFVVLLLNINPIIERLRPQIEQKLSSALGHPVGFEDLSVQFFPSTQIALSNFSVEGTKDNRIGTLALKTSISDLLSGSIAVEELSISDASIHIIKKKDNSLFLGPIPLQAKKQAAIADESDYSIQTVALTTPTTSGPAPSSEQDVALELTSLVLSNVEVTFEDQRPKNTQKLTISDLEGTIVNIAPKREGEIKLRASLFSSKKQNLRISGPITLAAGPMGLPLADISVQADSLDAKLINNIAAAYGQSVPQLTLSDSFDINLRIEITKSGINLSSEGVDASDLGVNYGKIFSKSPGETLLTRFSAKPYFNGALEAKKVTLNVGDNVINAPLSFSKAKGLALDLSSESISLADLAKMLPQLQQLGAAGSIVPNLKLEQKPRTNLTVNGSIGLNSISLGLPTEHGKLELNELQGELILSGDKLESKKLSIILADQKLESNFSAKPLTTPKVDWNISSESLFLAPLLKPFAIDNAYTKESSLSNLDLSGSHSTKSMGGNAKIAFAKAKLGGEDIGKSNLEVRYNIAAGRPQSFTLLPSTIGIFSGTADINAAVQDKRAEFSLKASEMQLLPISSLAASSSSLQLSGDLQAAILKGVLSLDSPAKTISGSFIADAKDGELRGFNLLRETLGKIDSIPGLQGQLMNYFPQKYADILNTDSTKFDTLKVRAKLGNAQADISSLDLVHSLYELSAQGVAGFNGTCNLRSQLKLTPELSEEMVLKEPKLELLLDSNRNIVIPVLIKKAEHILVLPDVSDLGKRALKNSAKEAVSKELDRVTPGLGKALEGLFK